MDKWLKNNKSQNPDDEEAQKFIIPQKRRKIFPE
jgi:hypothetical protein